MTWSTWLNFTLGILIVFALWWIFFSIIADRESRGGFFNANMIELTYIPTLASLGIIGASFPGLIAHFENPGADHSIKLYFGCSLFVFLAGIALLSYHLQYPEDYTQAKRNIRKLLMGSGAAIVIITILFHDLVLPVYLLSILVLLLVIIIAVTRIWFLIQMKQMVDKN